METINTVLILFFAVVVSGALSRMSPWSLPLPLVQIAIGAAAATVTDLRVKLEPEIFFVLFVPPLLFLDGWRIPKDGLFRDKTTILELAFGLVVFTVLGVGFFVHWMIPAVPLAVAFALAATLSPTDPIAVSAIAARAPIPKRMMHILEGESLLNDASGLVCMRFAIAAVLTGSFSIVRALGTFVWVAAGGIVVGLLVTWLTFHIKTWVTRRYGEETGAQILVSLLIPFGAYLLAERLRCSGILAAVAAGIAMSYAERSGKALAITRIRRSVVWDTIQFAANGIIFVLLGEQLLQIITGATQAVRVTGHHQPSWLFVYAAAITGALIVPRFLWVWASLRLNLFRTARRGHKSQPASWRLIAAMSLAGVRGTITLAGIMTLPLALADGTPFPARQLAIFLAALVIVLSLIVASLGLPFLLRGLELPPEPSHQKEEDRARIAAAHAAILGIQRAQHELGEGLPDADLYSETGVRIMELYRQRIEGRSHTGAKAQLTRKRDEIERKLRLAGLRAERDELHRIASSPETDDELLRKLVREVDLLEDRLGTT